MNILYIRHKFGGMSPLRPDEELVYSQERFRAVTVSCAALSRGLWIPPFYFSIRIYVTNRRILLSCLMMPFYRQEIDLWFPGQQPKGLGDSVTDVSRARGYYGPCLEVRSKDPQRRETWFSAPELTTRIYCEDLDALEGAIREAMGENGGSESAGVAGLPGRRGTSSLPHPTTKRPICSLSTGSTSAVRSTSLSS